MTWTVIAGDDAAKVSEALQPMLVDLIDLHLVGKQAHWTVVGERFQPAHERLDVLIDQWRLWSDSVAERIVILGVLPRGRAEDVVSDGDAAPFPVAWLPAGEAIALVADRVEAVARRARAQQAVVEDLDVVSDGLIQTIIEGLEEQLWMLRAHLR
jgi:starvation-inducible DNA-binding protein